MSSDCGKLDPLVTPYVDGELDAGAREFIDGHLRECPSCRFRVAAELAARQLLHSRRPAMQRDRAPEALRARCVAARSSALGSSSETVVVGARAGSRPATWRARTASFALAASLVLVVGGTFIYGLTVRSERIMAAELIADHVKCFSVINRLLGTAEDRDTVEQSIGRRFGWHMRLPETAAFAGLQLVGARPCLYGEGLVAHIMYRHNGNAVSVFMLPEAARSDQVIQVLGHEAAIWSAGNRTFVLIAREPRGEVERMASFVQAGLR